MYKYVLFINMFSIIFLAGCATNKARSQKIYTSTEQVKMYYCVGLSNTAMYIANEKLKKRPKTQLLTYYSKQTGSRINIAIVQKIYGAKFTNSWDYSISLFNECANNIAVVPSSRVRLASYCAQNTFIAGVAYDFKRLSYPKSEAHKKFEKFKSNTPYKIVNEVYLSNNTRSQALRNAWNNCMRKISG